MRVLQKIGVLVLVTSVLFGHFIHRPIPAEVPDPWQFQLLVDILATSEFAATVSESLGLYRWWSYPGNIDVAVPFSYPHGMEVTTVQFAGVETTVITPQAYKVRDKPGPAIVFYHGGGWVFGSVNTYMALLTQAAEETGFVVVSPEYRRAPSFPFPVPYEDCLYSTIEFMKRSAEFHVDPNKIVLAGDSAGGNLAMAITLDLLRRKENDPAIVTSSMTGLIYPILQMANFRLPSYQQNEAFVFSRNLIPKFWLAYIGFNSNLEFSDIVIDNGHVNHTNPELEEILKIVSSDAVPKKYKTRGFNSSLAKLPETLSDDVMLEMQKKFLDTRMAPLMANDDELSKMPRTHILVCEYDCVRDDGILLHERLQKLHRNSTLQYLPSSLHATVSLGSVFKDSYHGKQNMIFFKTIKDYFY